MAKAHNGCSSIMLFPELRFNNLLLADDESHLPPPELHSFKDEDFNSLLINQNRISSASSKGAGDEFYANPSLTQHKLQIARFQYLKQQQLIKNQVSAARRTPCVEKGSHPFGFFSSSSSPPVLKSQPGSAMRAVFFNPRKESSGTGVFLPRQHRSSKDHRKQPACSTALLPARVVQALNLNLDELCLYPRALSHGMGLAGNQKRSSGRNRSTWGAVAADRLPQEWTY